MFVPYARMCHLCCQYALSVCVLFEWLPKLGWKMCPFCHGLAAGSRMLYTEDLLGLGEQVRRGK